MMYNKLEYSFEGQGEKIMKMLGDQNFITGQDIDYQHCDMIDEFNLGDVENLREAIRTECEKIAKLMSDESMIGKRNILSNNLQNIVFGNIKGIVRSDIISPLSNMMTGVIGEYGRQFIEKRELNEKLEKLSKELNDLEGNTKASPKISKYNDKSRYTESGSDVKVGVKTQIVVEGDTLWDIDKDNGKTVEEMLRSNPHLKMDKKGFVLIKPGDKLVIPAGSTPQPAATSNQVYGPLLLLLSRVIKIIL